MQLHTQADGMSLKSLIIVFTIIIISNSFIVVNNFEPCQAAVLPKYYVDDNYNATTPGWNVDHFSNISDAINASSAGDRIIVYAGTYNETLVISHKLDIFGENRDITIINGNYNGDVITINAQHVNISHFTIKNSGNDSSVIKINSGYTTITDNKITNGKQGILLSNCDYNILYDNIITSNNGDGIKLNHSDHNSITYNTVTSNLNGVFLYNSSYNSIENNSAIKTNTENGVFLNETSNYNTILYNNISSNNMNGVFLNDHCDQNTISHNEIYLNNDSGIRMENSSQNTLQVNTVNKNTNYGIMIVGSNNTIQQNTISNNSQHGIFLFADDFNTVYNNVIKGNTKTGIHMSNSTNDTIYSNEIANNQEYGIYLDYFTVNNLIYNNYFHNNNDNSVDKSLNHNQWNITKTNGTNKVGGTVLCGNYWDDFDETSEGAYDTNNDSIADSAYTIYASNKDYGALLDITPSTIGTPSATPTSQTIGSYTYISVTATDNTEIKQIYLHIIDPNSQTTNFSIKQNKTGDTYYCYKKFTPIGTYTYHIAVKDPRNWVTSDTYSFNIVEGTSPTITDNSPTTGSPSKHFIFNATVTDDEDSPSELTVKVAWKHDGKSGNYTMVNTEGDFFEQIIKLQNTTSPMTYTIYASDQWGNSISTTQKTVKIIDTEPPTITIIKNNYTSDNVRKEFTIQAKITDNHEVKTAKIEYWYGENNHKIADMDKTGDYYQKTIQIEPEVDKVYCIINATDPSGNQNETGKPYGKTGGPYNGVTKVDIEFNASKSFDLDGEITNYTWNFGDGTTADGVKTTHSYLTNGNYTVTLTVTDNEGNTDTETTYANIIQSTQIKTSNTSKKEIENKFNITLTKQFYSYDADGDNLVDTFVDPNNILKSVHTGNINIKNNTVFLISTDDSLIPEFIWNTTTDKIISITYKKGITNGTPEIDKTNNIVTQKISTNKTNGWIYLEVADPDIGEYGKINNVINVTKKQTQIPTDRIIRKNSKTYILDDPETTYIIRYSYQPPTLNKAVFSPTTGGTIDRNNQTIKITYNVPVTIIDAAFYMIDPETTLPTDGGPNIDITDLLKPSNNNKEYTYTPPNNLDEGYYEIFVFVKQKNSTKTMDSSAKYKYIPYGKQEMQTPFSILLPILGGIIATLVMIYVVFRYKNITLESFVYFKNKKIIPFFKPLIIGPLKIDVDDEKISKAEFYLNGELKDTITQAPYIWKLDKPMFNKQKIETKVYDQDGNVISSGEMTFYVINPPRFFK